MKLNCYLNYCYVSHIETAETTESPIVKIAGHKYMSFLQNVRLITQFLGTIKKSVIRIIVDIKMSVLI